MFFRARNGAAVLLMGIIAAAGCAIWNEGPGETRRKVQRNGLVADEIHTVCVAALEYAQDHSETYPDAVHWEQELRPYLNKSFPDFTLPALRNEKPHRIAINSNIAGHKMEDLLAPASAVLFFESTTARHNAADALASLPTESENVAIGYADGHCYVYPSAWRQTLQVEHFRREALGELVTPQIAARQTAASRVR